jgi:predicted TIM-barrel fold metal-dependent hydrolase
MQLRRLLENSVVRVAGDTVTASAQIVDIMPILLEIRGGLAEAGAEVLADGRAFICSFHDSSSSSSSIDLPGLLSRFPRVEVVLSHSSVSAVIYRSPFVRSLG